MENMYTIAAMAKELGMSSPGMRLVIEKMGIQAIGKIPFGEKKMLVFAEEDKNIIQEARDSK